MIWKCGDKDIKYGDRTLIMGIVNVTPDSFSDGGKYFDSSLAVNHALNLINQGADIIDIGAQSTRPGYNEISEYEEWSRLQGVIAALRSQSDIPISVDTYYPYVANKAIESGADIINDVSGIFSDEMADIVKKTKCAWVLMHSGNGSVSDVSSFFDDCIKKAELFGIDKKQLCFDMGIGFGKSNDENIELIANVSLCKKQGFPLLLGVSRKRVIGYMSHQSSAEKRIFGNIAADTVAIMGGADIIRLHDVENELQGILTADTLKGRIYNNG